MSTEYKRETIAYCIETVIGSGSTVSDVSRNSGIPYATISSWIRKYHSPRANKQREIIVLNLKSRV